MRSASTRSLSLSVFFSFFCLRCSDCKLHLLLMHACLCVCVLSVVCLLFFSLSIWFFGFSFLFFAAAKFFFFFHFVLTALPVTLIRLFCALRHCLGIRLATAAVVAVVAVAAAASADVAGSATAIHF